MQEPVPQRMVRGVSTRDYGEVIEAFETGYGIKHSGISRSFVRASKAALERLLGRSFVGVRFAAIMIDGVEYAGMTVVVALGIDSEGNKHVLGLKEGATENATVVRDLLCDLRERGVSTEQPTLFIIDGGKALAKDVSDLFGTNALIQRCQIHKKRNIRSYLVEEHWRDLDNRLAQA